MPPSPTTSSFSPCDLHAEARTDEPSPLQLLKDCTVRELHEQLQAHERRLGTPAELPGDFDRARALAHEINNRAQRDYLRALLGLHADAEPLLNAALAHRLVA